MTSPLVLAAQPKDQSVPEGSGEGRQPKRERLPRGLRRHPGRSVSPARSRQSTTDRTNAGRNTSRGAESSACQAVTDFLSLIANEWRASVYNRGYAASREQAMRYFKARYIGPSN